MKSIEYYVSIFMGKNDLDLHEFFKELNCETDIIKATNKFWYSIDGVRLRAAIDIFYGPVDRENLKDALAMYASMIV